MALYSVEIRDPFGRLVTVLKRPLSKQFSLYRNKPGACQFNLDLYDPQATPENLKVNQYDVVFRRQGTLVFAGQITSVVPQIDGDQKTVQVIATGYFALFDSRYIDSDYPDYDALQQQLPFASTDASQVAWKLVDDSQFPLASDGSQTLSGTSMTLCQSFVAQGTADLRTIKLLLKNVNASGNLKIAIAPDLAGIPSSTAVTNSEKTIAADDISSDLSWYEITYASGSRPALTRGATYWITAKMDTAQTTGDGIEWSYLNDNYYLAGKALCLQNSNLFTSTQDLQFFIQQADNSWQMTKNTYFGIAEGNLPTSYDITPVYDQYKKIKEAIEDIANTYNGIDFAVVSSIDPTTNILTKAFTTFYPRQGIDNTRLNFSYPGNIKKLNNQGDGATMVNEVTMRGQGSGVYQVTATEDNAASIQAYGQRQDTQSQSDVSDEGTLELMGRELIRVSKDPLDLPQIVLDGNQPPHVSGFGVGDQIQFSIRDIPILNRFSGIVFRIEELDVTVTDDDQEEVAVTTSIA